MVKPIHRQSIMKILLIEDDGQLALITKKKLQSVHLLVDHAFTGEEGLRLAKLGYYDVVLVDLLLDIALNGLEVVRLIRKFDHSIPILVLTGLQDIETKVSAFSAGADDFLSKPFHFQELVARITRLYKRINRPYLTRLHYRELQYDVERRCVSLGTQKIFLKNKESRLMEYFFQNPERALSRSEIINAVWHVGSDETSNVVEVAIRQLRQKVDRNLGIKLIHTVHGVGYRLAL